MHIQVDMGGKGEPKDLTDVWLDLANAYGCNGTTVCQKEEAASTLIRQSNLQPTSSLLDETEHWDIDVDLQR